MTTAALNNRWAMPKWMKIGVTKRHSCPLANTACSDASCTRQSPLATGTIVNHGNTGPQTPLSSGHVAGKKTNAVAITQVTTG